MSGGDDSDDSDDDDDDDNVGGEGDDGNGDGGDEERASGRKGQRPRGTRVDIHARSPRSAHKAPQLSPLPIPRTRLSPRSA